MILNIGAKIKILFGKSNNDVTCTFLPENSFFPRRKSSKIDRVKSVVFFWRMAGELVVRDSHLWSLRSIAAGFKLSPTTMRRVMRSLMELSARTVLRAGLDLDDDSEYVNLVVGDSIHYGPATRCDCDFFYEDFKTDHTTTQYIDVLPLPTTVKAGLFYGQSR